MSAVVPDILYVKLEEVDRRDGVPAVGWNERLKLVNRNEMDSKECLLWKCFDHDR